MMIENISLKNQKIDNPNEHDVDIDMVQKPSYAQVMIESLGEEMCDQYWETIHAIVNQTLQDMQPNNEYILVDTEAEDIVEMDLTHKDILKVFLMFHD
jgi:hypothetical protein